MRTLLMTRRRSGAAKARNGKVAPDEEVHDDKEIKPIFLKGLFR
jgi:hypothetical protein